MFHLVPPLYAAGPDALGGRPTISPAALDRMKTLAKQAESTTSKSELLDLQREMEFLKEGNDPKDYTKVSGGAEQALATAGARAKSGVRGAYAGDAEPRTAAQVQAEMNAIRDKLITANPGDIGELKRLSGEYQAKQAELKALQEGPKQQSPLDPEKLSVGKIERDLKALNAQLEPVLKGGDQAAIQRGLAELQTLTDELGRRTQQRDSFKQVADSLDQAIQAMGDSAPKQMLEQRAKIGQLLELME